MQKNHTLIQKEFNCGINPLFDALADHNTMGVWLGADIHRTTDSTVKDEGLNGTGSVRTIKMFGLPDFDETVVVFKKPSRIEYKITRGSPLRNHHGIIELSEKAGIVNLEWNIRFDMAIPLTGALTAWILKTSIGGGLKKLKKELEANK